MQPRGEAAAVRVLEADAAAPRRLEPLRRRLGQVVLQAGRGGAGGAGLVYATRGRV